VVDLRAGMWAHILRDQLAVEPGLFWACVRGGEAPDRGARPRPAGCSIPASLAAVLLSQVGLSDAEVAAMSRDEAIERSTSSGPHDCDDAAGSTPRTKPESAASHKYLFSAAAFPVRCATPSAGPTARTGRAGPELPRTEHK